MLSPHSPRAAPAQCYPHTRREQHPLNAIPTLAARSTPSASSTPHTPKHAKHAPYRVCERSPPINAASVSSIPRENAITLKSSPISASDSNFCTALAAGR